MPDGRAALREVIESHDWYHTVEVEPGVLTPGWFDTREVVGQIPFPSSLEGKRCLDIGTFDGFWAFEMERRGAAEVVAIDILDPRRWDWPAGSSAEVQQALDARKAGGQGFEFLHGILDSSVQRQELSVYDLGPELGTFDFVYFGSLLLHLRDPIRALEAAASVCTGQMLCVDAINFTLTKLFPRFPVARLDGVGRPWWWQPNAAGFAQMIRVAGLQIVEGPTRLYMPYGPTNRPARPRVRSLRSVTGMERAVHWRYGDPHAAVLARPSG